jgi:hypothetical protein
MSTAIDMYEHVPYSASFELSTRAVRAADYRAKPPVLSPAGVIHYEREKRMRALLSENILEDGISPNVCALENFKILLRLLPHDFPVTDPYVSDCGSIALDWDFDPRFQLSIMLKENNQIAFAAYFSGEKVHGSSRFLGHKLPETLANVANQWARLAGIRGSQSA